LSWKTLRDLDNGDIFYHKNDKLKSPKKFVVYGNPYFNERHGSACRRCKLINRLETIGKSCNLLVIKCGESKNKMKIQALFNQKIEKP